MADKRCKRHKRRPMGQTPRTKVRYRRAEPISNLHFNNTIITLTDPKAQFGLGKCRAVILRVHPKEYALRSTSGGGGAARRAMDHGLL
jgi:hypothetical protein